MGAQKSKDKYCAQLLKRFTYTETSKLFIKVIYKLKQNYSINFKINSRMNSGIIIVFNNDQQLIDVDYIVKILDENNFKICLVNNARSDKTSSVLSRIKFQSKVNSNVFILDNKYDKGLKYAVKAGARFLLNETEFDSIIYLESNIVIYLKYIKDFFVRLASKKETFTQYPTRSGRNVLNGVFPFEDLLKMKTSY